MDSNTIELLFTFEPTTDNGFMVGCLTITESMPYRQQYKEQAQYIFEGKTRKVFCLFNCGVVCSRGHALHIVTSMIERNPRVQNK